MPIWTILICCRNAVNRIGPTIEALGKLTNISDCELIVIDSSIDGTEEIVKSSLVIPKLLHFHYEFDSPKGLGYSRLKGLQMAAGSFICCVDDDNHLDPEYLIRAEYHFKNNPRIGAIGGQSSLPDNYDYPLWLHLYGRAFAVGDQHPNGLLSWGRTVWGAGMCLRREAWKVVQELGFKPHLGTFINGYHIAGDDTEVGLSMAAVGWRSYYDSRMRLAHAIDDSRLQLKVLLKRFIEIGLAINICMDYQKLLVPRQSEEETRAPHSSLIVNNLTMLTRGFKRACNISPAKMPVYFSIGLLTWLAMWYGVLLGYFSTRNLRKSSNSQLKLQIAHYTDNYNNI